MKKGFGFLALTVVLFAFALTFFLPLTPASFAKGTPNYSITKVYGPSQSITGWVNISLSNEPINSLFESDIGSADNSINLSEMLDMNPSYTYSCSPLNCENDYLVGSSQNSLVFQMVGQDTERAGLRFTGNVTGITSVSFDVDSDANVSCASQLKIDLLDDGVVDFQNDQTSPGGTTCSAPNYGCFLDSAAKGFYTLDRQYCQRVNISETPSVRVGAYVRKNSGNLNLTMEIHRLNGDPKGSCNLPAIGAEGEYYCDVDYAVLQPEEHYVCIYPNLGTGDYELEGNSDTQNFCGFQGNSFGVPEAGAYHIFAQGKQFAAFDTARITNTLQSGDISSEIVYDYLVEKYGKRNEIIDCSAGCVVPITLKSSMSQQATLKNLTLKYGKTAGGVIENGFYSITGVVPPKITSGFQKIYLDTAGFTVPDDTGNYTFSLKLNGTTILSERISVADIPIIQALTPTRVAAAFPTDFTVKVSLARNRNLSRVTWNFGDGTLAVITQGSGLNTTTHAYNQTGEYTIIVNVTDSGQFSSSKTFFVNVTSPEDMIELSLAELRASLTTIKADIATLDSFSKAAINRSLGLGAFEASISGLESRYNSATTEAQLNSIVADILALGVLPESISKTRGATGLPLVVSTEDVSLDAIESIAGGAVTENEEAYAAAAAFWPFENLETKMDFGEFSGIYESGGLQPVTKTFKMTIREKKDIGYDYYLIMPELAGFYSDSGFKNKSGYVYVNLKDKNSVSFATTEDLDLTDLPAFISPAITRLSVTETTPPEEEKTNKWLIFGLVLVALLVIGIIVYIVLQEWYRRKYEKHLFPNRNDLYNMATYIHNAKRRNMGNSDIEDNLKKAGWSAERIRYAMRKYAGKRTGMLEIPITKAVKKIEGK